MSDKQIYEVLIREGGQIIRYLMEAEILENYFEPKEKEKLHNLFKDSHYGDETQYEILEIKPTDFLDFIKTL